MTRRSLVVAAAATALWALAAASCASPGRIEGDAVVSPEADAAWELAAPSAQPAERPDPHILDEAATPTTNPGPSPAAAGGDPVPRDEVMAGPVSTTGPAGAFGRSLGQAEGLPEPRPVVRPVALRIPAIGVESAAIVAVGVEPDGAMEIPPSDQVGWYRHGVGPGTGGSQVLAAHVAADGRDGVFRRLADLNAGDAIDVVDESGVTHRYRLVGLGTFEKEQLPFDALFDRTGDERLVLITCGGDFNPQLRSYESNVVAFAVPIGA